MKQGLLGMVFRSDLGTNQVTYAGHPLYLFDMSAGQITGEGWDEPGLPPWHGLWYLVSPKGTPVPWAGMLTTAPSADETVLAAQMETVAGWNAFPVYRYTKASAPVRVLARGHRCSLREHPAPPATSEPAGWAPGRSPTG